MDTQGGDMMINKNINLVGLGRQKIISSVQLDQPLRLPFYLDLRDHIETKNKPI